MKGRDLDELAARLETRERELAEREAAIGSTEKLADRRDGASSGARRRPTSSRRPSASAIREPDDREAEFDAREAKFDTDIELREGKLGRGGRELTDLEERLEKKEAELAAYVEQVQVSLMNKREAVG